MKSSTLEKRLTKIFEAGGFGLQSIFDKEYDGGCPCFSGKFDLDGEKCEIAGYCWRVSKNAQDLEIKCSNTKIIKLIKKCIDAQEWYNKYTIIRHKESFL